MGKDPAAANDFASAAAILDRIIEPHLGAKSAAVRYETTVALVVFLGKSSISAEFGFFAGILGLFEEYNLKSLNEMGFKIK